MSINNSGVEDPTQYKIDMTINYSGVEDHPRKIQIQFQKYHMLPSICHSSVHVSANISIHLLLQCIGVSKYQHPSVTLHALVLQNIKIPTHIMVVPWYLYNQHCRHLQHHVVCKGCMSPASA